MMDDLFIMDKKYHYRKQMEHMDAANSNINLGIHETSQSICYLHDYFNIYIINTALALAVSASRHTFRFPILAVVSQNVTNKICLVCVWSEKYSLWVTLRPLGSMRQSEAELHI